MATLLFFLTVLRVATVYSQDDQKFVATLKPAQNIGIRDQNRRRHLPEAPQCRCTDHGPWLDIEYRKGDTTSVVTKKEIDDYFQRLKTIHNAAEESLNRVYST
jgi:hypothetical protein